MKDSSLHEPTDMTDSRNVTHLYFKLLRVACSANQWPPIDLRSLGGAWIIIMTSPLTISNSSCMLHQSRCGRLRHRPFPIDWGYQKSSYCCHIDQHHIITRECTQKYQDIQYIVTYHTSSVWNLQLFNIVHTSKISKGIHQVWLFKHIQIYKVLFKNFLMAGCL